MDVGECKYDKNVPVLVEERKTFLNLKLNLIEKKLITVEATDEKDPFFLFTLQINETDFHNLKKEQALAVDFLSFPQTLLELLDHVESESSRYQCVFTQGQLCIMEGGKMRPLPHIILQLKPANDATLKKYLANKLQEFKNLCNRLRISLEETQKESEYKIMHLETKLEEISRTKETTELEQTKAISEWKLQHSAAIAEEKEKSLYLQRQLQQTHEKEVKERERKYEIQTNQLRNQIQGLHEEVSQLTSIRINLENELKTVNSRLQATETELSRFKSDAVSELQLKVGAFERKLIDKDELLSKVSALLEASNSQKANLEESLNLYKTNAVQYEEKIQTYKSEIKKGNQIIQQFQNLLKTSKAKLKSQQSILSKQEQEWKDKISAADRVTVELTSLKKEFEEKNNQYRQLQESFQEQKKQIEDLQNENKKNDELIKIMSKQTLGISSIPRQNVLSPSNTNSQYQYRPSFKSQHPSLVAKTNMSTSTSNVSLSPSIINPVK